MSMRETRGFYVTESGIVGNEKAAANESQFFLSFTDVNSLVISVACRRKSGNASASDIIVIKKGKFFTDDHVSFLALFDIICHKEQMPSVDICSFFLNNPREQGIASLYKTRARR